MMPAAKPSLLSVRPRQRIAWEHRRRAQACPRGEQPAACQLLAATVSHSVRRPLPVDAGISVPGRTRPGNGQPVCRAWARRTGAWGLDNPLGQGVVVLAGAQITYTVAVLLVWAVLPQTSAPQPVLPLG
jgi:hypothetical protein